MKKILKNKNIIVTAGSTWVPIDKVRIITNIFGGTLGYIIAKTAWQMGAKVTLLMGPGRIDLKQPVKAVKGFRIIRFKYFDEILKLIKREVFSKKYNVIVHSAAIADYSPVFLEKGKIKSGKENLVIKLKPTVKIIDLIKKIDPSIFLVKFKLEVGLTKKQLINVAYKSMLFSKADLVVANDFKNISTEHIAFIIDNNKNIIECKGKEIIAQKLLRKIAELL